MKRGFSLVEMMVVLGLFTFLFGGILTVLAVSDRSWRGGKNKLIEQQEARKVINNISRLLRQSNPDWVISDTHYPVSITEQSKRIDFYNPVFNTDGQISSLKKVTFKLNPDNAHELLKKEGTSNTVVVTGEVEDISFGGGCSGCASFDCAVVAGDCPVVRIEVKTKKDLEFSLASEVTLRNQSIVLSSDVTVDEPAEGEF